MRRVTVHATTPDEQVVAACAQALRAGSIVAYPTDTLYGLGVDPESERAVGALFAIKERAGDQALPLIAASFEQAEGIARLTPIARRLADRFWPGRLTIVVPAARAFARGVAAADGSIAVRVPDQPIARAIAAAFGRPLTATSANRSGEPPAVTADDVIAAFGETIEIVLDAGPAASRAPSTIVDACGSTPRLLRAGAVAWERVLESLQ
jgi:L-threonylcarbamoyladenylate synthase